MHAHIGGSQLLAHIPPTGAALQRELSIPVGAVLVQPTPQRGPRCRPDLPPPHQSIVVHVVERDLLPMHVKPAYHRHWDLLTLPKTSDANSTSV